MVSLNTNAGTRAFLVVLMGVGLLSAVASADETVTFKQGATNPFTVGAYNGTDDLHLISAASADKNYGGATFVDVGSASSVVRRLLVRFDLTDFAGQYEDISSVTLRLYVNSTAFGSAGNTIQLYRVGAANADWVESDGYGSTDPNVSTWNNRLAPSTGWDGGPGLGDTGYNTLLDSVAWTTATAPVGSALDLTFTGTDAKAVIDSMASSANAGGLFLRSVNEGGGTAQMLRFYSSETDTATYTPELIVNYTTPVPEPATMAMLGLGGVMMLIRRRRKIA